MYLVEGPLVIVQYIIRALARARADPSISSLARSLPPLQAACVASVANATCI